VFGWGLIFIVLFPVVLWTSVNLLGLAGNARMRDQIQRLVTQRGTEIPKEAWFCGFSRPGEFGVLDPHLDLGFVWMDDKAVYFHGETVIVALKKECVSDIHRRWNPHSWVRLGGWIALEGEVDAKQVRLLIEPRQEKTLLRNRALTFRIIEQLKDWQKRAK